MVRGVCTGLFPAGQLEVPIEKRTADLQWRIVHGAVAHIDTTTSTSCLYCSQEETLEHLWLRCPRLNRVLSLTKKWFNGLSEDFDDCVFIFDPKYKPASKKKIIILNFLLRQVKLAIWLSRKNKGKGLASCDGELLQK